MEINPPLELPNGSKRAAFEVMSDGSVYLLCDDNTIRRVHPAVVAAFGDGRIAPGVWQIASARMQNPHAVGIIMPPGALTM